MSAPRTLYEGQFLRLVEQGHWEYVQRVRARGAVHILALTADNEILLVEQLRPPVGQTVIELPAGIVGDEVGHEQETAEQAAARELVEETGYRPARVECIHQGPSSPGMAAEIITLVRAWDLTRVGDGGGVDSEDIRVHRVAIAQVSAWLAARVAAGQLTDHRVYAALYFMQQMDSVPV